jgi:uncharacterized repeat protein (TIGR03803 family)
MTKHMPSLSGALNFGCAFLALFAATAVSLPAQTLTYLYTFDGSNGADPGGLVQSTNGDIYGLTGDGTATGNKGGTVFSMTTSGTLTNLFNFPDCSTDCSSLGVFPQGMIQATDGNFYGITSNGGLNGLGTVFKMTPSGELTTIYSFCSLAGCADGSGPEGGLVQGTNGNFYGTTSYGGVENDGTIFEVTPSGTLTTLYSFCQLTNCLDGSRPEVGLALAPNGNLFGVTSAGGAGGVLPGDGTAFEVTPSGVFTSLYSFCTQSGCPDGAFPSSALALATDGNFYGVTTAGGPTNHGTIYRITTSGTVTTLHHFCSLKKCADGYDAYAPLVQGTDGNLYGTTPKGGASGQGIIFNITLSGTFTALYSFDNPIATDPTPTLLQDTNGVFYGTTGAGGPTGWGSIFSFSMGLAPFVRVEPLSSPVGSEVQILGTDLTGATSVTFDGTPAVFTVNSTGTSITATVPAGTKRGTVDVVTPGGTLASYPPFYPLHY